MKQIAIMIAALCCLSESAFAFCGFYVAKADAKLFNKSSQVILVRDGNHTVITMSNDFEGAVEDFAMVVPVPEVLQESDIRVVQQNIFDKLNPSVLFRPEDFVKSNGQRRNDEQSPNGSRRLQVEDVGQHKCQNPHQDGPKHPPHTVIRGRHGISNHEKGEKKQRTIGQVMQVMIQWPTQVKNCPYQFHSRKGKKKGQTGVDPPHLQEHNQSRSSHEIKHYRTAAPLPRRNPGIFSQQNARNNPKIDRVEHMLSLQANQKLAPYRQCPRNQHRLHRIRLQQKAQTERRNRRTLERLPLLSVNTDKNRLNPQANRKSQGQLGQVGIPAQRQNAVHQKETQINDLKMAGILLQKPERPLHQKKNRGIGKCRIHPSIFMGLHS